MAIDDARVHNIIQSLIPATSDTNLFGADVLEHAVETALLWHSQFLPQRSIMMGTGDGSTARWLLPSDMIYIRNVEVPYGEAPPEYLSGTNWHVHQGTAGLEIVFEDQIGSADVFAVHYAGSWQSTDMKASEEQPMAHLACAFICTREATRMAHNTSPIIEAEVVNYRDLSRTWLRLYEHFIGLYAQFYGLSAERVKQGAPPYAFGIGSVPSHQRYDRFWWVT